MIAAGGLDGSDSWLPAQSPENQQSAQQWSTIKTGSNGHSPEAWWCSEHGVPESVCALCSTKLAADFKAKGDWCKEHDRPESQCFACHPELEAKFASQYEAKYGTQPPKPTETADEPDHHGWPTAPLIRTTVTDPKEGIKRAAVERLLSVSVRTSPVGFFQRDFHRLFVLFSPRLITTGTRSPALNFRSALSKSSRLPIRLSPNLMMMSPARIPARSAGPSFVTPVNA